MKTILTIEGMSCEHCVKRVIDAVSAIHGVKHVEIDLKTKKAAIEHDHADISEIIDAVSDLGFEANE